VTFISPRISSQWGEETLRLVHEAKKLAGAKVTGDEGGYLC